MQKPSHSPKHTELINWLLIGAVVVGRLGLSVLYKLNLAFDAPWDSRLMTFTLITVSLFILLNENTLQNYNFSRLSVWFISVSKLFTLVTVFLSNPNKELAEIFEPIELLGIAAVIGMIISVRKWLFAKPLATAKEWKWLGFGVIGALIVLMVSAYPQAIQIRGYVPNFVRPSLTNFLFALIALPFQIGYAGVFEEPVFRGMLWGQFKKSGWSVWVVWLSQTFLFTLAHIHYLPHQPYAFWVTAPLGGLVLGALAWGSGSLAGPLLAHGLINALMSFAAYAAYFWFL